MALVMSGCSSLRAPVTSGWRLTGKLFVSAPEASRVMFIDWRKSADVHQIDLSGSFGLSVAQVLVEGSLVTVTAGGEIYQARGLVRLPLKKGHHLDIPILPVLDWMDLMASGTGQRRLVVEDRIPGWTVKVTGWEDRRPSLVRFDSGETSLRLRVSGWFAADVRRRSFLP